ncbi:MAG: 30S ribosomal protein S20 [Candidatus Izimaplasma sp.]|nr:30S ribosomal protein S20 [Candidatus Izimaplasma bacterium]
MANIQDQIKRNRQNEKRRERNYSFKAGLKTAIRQVREAVETGDKEQAVEALNLANKKLDKSLSKGINKKNKVARKKSQLAKLVNTLPVD